jgi:hypothetical protein
MRMLPRAAILVTSLAELFAGDRLYGAFCIVALGVTLIPAIHARRLDAGIPLSLELALLWLMVADMTFGNWLGLYYSLTWFDKVLHLSNSVLIGMIGFLAIYVLHLTGDRGFHPWLDAVAILLVTLGIGALWEISEYFVDQVFSRTSQGSPNMNPLDDTMIDLILDGLGALIAAIIGPRYIRRAAHHRAQLLELANRLPRAD